MRPNIFRIAAKIVSEKRVCACTVLDDILSRESAFGCLGRELDFFRYLFKPEWCEVQDLWWGTKNSYKEQLARSIALLLCAEISKDLVIETKREFDKYEKQKWGE